MGIMVFRALALPGALASILAATECFHALAAEKMAVRFVVARYPATERFRVAAAGTDARCALVAIREPVADRTGAALPFVEARRCALVVRNGVELPSAKARRYELAVRIGAELRFAKARTLSVSRQHLAMGCCAPAGGVLPASVPEFARRFDIPSNATACQTE